jgi:hypothetical protein
MIMQSSESLNWDNFGIPPWESWDKKPFGCGCHGEAHSILYRGRWWLPPSPSRGESCEPRVVVACLSTKGVSESDLTNLFVRFDAGSNK